MVQSFYYLVLSASSLSSVLGECRPGWSQYGVKCYMIKDYPSNVNWDTCKRYCDGLDATMLCVESADENEFSPVVRPLGPLSGSDTMIVPRNGSGNGLRAVIPSTVIGIRENRMTTAAMKIVGSYMGVRGTAVII